MAVDVIIDPLTGQIYWNDSQGTAQSIAISGNGTDLIKTVGYSLQFSASPAGTITSGSATTAVTGSGTNFLTLFGSGSAGSGAVLYTSQGTSIGTISTVTSDTALTLQANASGSYSGVAFRYSPPAGTDRLIFSDSSTPIYPATTGANLGTSSYRWSLYASSGDITNSGTTSINLMLDKSGIGSTESPALQFINTTAATSGAQYQFAPWNEFRGKAWNTGSSASNDVRMRMGMAALSGNGPTAELVVAASVDTGTASWYYPLTLNATANDAVMYLNNGVLSIGKLLTSGTTSSYALELYNYSLATSGQTANWSPAFELNGSAWNTSTATSNILRFRSEVQTTSGNPISGSLVWKSAITTSYSATPSFSNNVSISNTNGFGLWNANTAASYLKASGSQSSDIVYTFPASAPTTNQVLSASTVSGSSITLTWATASGSGTVNSGASGKIAYYPSAGTTVDDATALDYSASSPHLTITSQATTSIPLKLTGIASQSVDLFQVATSGGNVFTIGSAGISTFANNTAASGTTSGALIITGGIGVGATSYLSDLYSIGTILSATSATTVNISTSAATKTINIGTGGTSSHTTTITIGTTAGTSTLTLDSPTITTNTTSLTLFNVNATTVNAFGAATALTLGATTGTGTIRNATIDFPNATTINGSSALATVFSSANPASLAVFGAATTATIFGSATTLTLGAATGTASIRNTTVTLTNSTVFNINGNDPVIQASTTGTVTLFNTSNTTVNAFGAATALTFGATTGTATIRNTTATFSNATVVNINGNDPTIQASTTGTVTLFNTSNTTVNAFGAATALTFGATTGTATIRNTTATFSNATVINVNGNDPVIQSSTTGTVTLFNTSNTTVNAFGAATAMTLGAATGTASIRNTTVTLTNATVFNINGNAPVVQASTTGTVTLFNTSNTTVNAFGAATALNLGSSAGTATIANATVTLSNATTVNVNGNAPTIQASTTGTVTLFNTSNTTVNAFGAATAVSLGAATGTFTIGNTTATLTNATNLNASAVSTLNLSTTVTGASTLNIGTGAVAGATKAINIGTAGSATGTTTIIIGTTSGTSTIALNGVTTLSSALAIGSGGTGTSSSPTQWGIIFATSTSQYSSTGAGTNNQWLRAVSSGAPTWSTASLATTYSQYDIVYAATANALSGLANSNTSVLVSQTAGPAWLQGATANRLLKTSGSAISWSQADLTTDVTEVLPIANGGTQTSSITAGGVVYMGSTAATGLQALSPVAANKFLVATGTATTNYPAWSTATLATTYAVGDLLYASSANTVGGLTSTATSVLITQGAAAPSWLQGATANRILKTSGSAISWSQVDLTTDVTGTLPVGNGGTGVTNIGAGRIMYGNNTGAVGTDANFSYSGTNDTLSLTGVNTTNPNIYIEKAGSANTAWIGLQLINTSATTSGATVQFSPSLEFQGHVWNTTPTAADNTARFREELQVTSAASPTATLVWKSSVDTGTASFTDRFKIDSTGLVTIPGSLVLGSATGALSASSGTVSVGTLSVANGGTGVASLTTSRLLVSNSASTTGAIETSTNIVHASTNLSLSPHGASAGNTYELRFLELAANGTSYTALKAPDSLAAEIVYTLPSSGPSVNQVLAASSVSGTSVTLAWATDATGSGGSGIVNSGASGKIAYYPALGTTVDDATALDYSASSPHLTITAQATTAIPLKLTGIASQSVDLLQVATSGGNVVTVGSAGISTFSNNTAASGTTSGALIVTGGIGVGSTSYLSTTNITTLTLTNALAVGSGGTGTSTAPTQWGVVFATSTAAYNSTAAGSTNQWLRAVSSGAPTWSTATLATTYAVGDLLYASSANVVGGLTSTATSVLITQGAAAPSWLQGATANRLLKTSGSAISWSQADLTTDVTGVLPVGNGGTGTSTAPTQWGVMFATSTAAIRSTAAGSTNQWLAAVSSGAPVWSTATLATTFTTGQFVYASGSNALTGLATTTFSVDTTNVRIGIGTSAASTPLHVVSAGAGTNAVVVMDTIDVQSTGTPANGFGGSILFDLESTTTIGQDAASIEAIWATATHASRLAELNFKTNDANTSTLTERLSISNITSAQSSTNATVVITGTLGVNSTSYLSSVSLNTALAIASGGTNTSSFATTNGLVYFNGTNLLTTNAAASGVLVTNASNVPSVATDIPTAVTIGGSYIYRAGGTDVPLSDGGTNASLTASAGGVVYSTASAMAINTPGSSGQPLLSGGAGAPTFGTLGMGAGGTGLTTTTPGANYVLGMNASNNGLEYKQLVQGSNITITHAANSVTITASGGSATPGGSNTQIQYNASGALGGISNFTFVSPLLSVTNATNFGTTSTAGLELKYSTAAGTSTVNNNSPAFDLIGRIYASAADRHARIRQEIQTTAATPAHALVWSSSYDTGTASYTKVLSLHNVDGLGFWNYAGTVGTAANYFKTGNQASDIRYTWPTSAPTVNQVLSATAVSGADITLGWATAGGGGGSGTVSSGTINQLAYYSGATTTASDASLVRSATGTHLTITAQGATTSPLKVVGAASQSAALFTVATSGGDVLVVGSTGNITTGTWQGTTVGVAYGGTGQTTYTDGQLLIGNSTGNTLTKATLTAGNGIGVTNGSGSITVRTKRVMNIQLASGFNPPVGADTAVIRIPESPTDGSTSVTYNVRKVFCRVETPSSGTSTFQVEYYTGTGAFSATNLLSSALSVTGASTYEFNTTGFSTSTLATGTKIRLNFSAVDSTHANFSINLLLEEN